MTAPSRRLAAAAMRFADQQSDRLADLPAARILLATVATATAGQPLTVTWRGADLPAAAHTAGWTPAAGQRVLCAVIDDQLIVVGALTTVV